jgi:hypothetical protein
VIKMRRAQLSFGDGLIREEVEDLREEWMIHADQVLEDEQLVAIPITRASNRTMACGPVAGAVARRSSRVCSISLICCFTIRWRSRSRLSAANVFGGIGSPSGVRRP